MIDENLIQLEKEATQWSQYEVMKLKMSIMKLSHKGKGELAKELRGSVRKNALGIIERVGFGFVRHGVFWQKGVGKGYSMQGGKVVRASRSVNKVVRYANAKYRDTNVFTSRSGEMKRFPVDWFNGPIDNGIPQLADMVTKYMADATVNATRMKIN